MLKFKINSIKSKIIFNVLIFLIPLFIIFAYIGEKYTKQTIYENILEKANVKAISASKALEKFNLKISEKPKKIANIISFNLNKGLQYTRKLIYNVILNNKSIYGMAIALFPEFSPDKKFYCTYYYRGKNGKIIHKNLIPPMYNYMDFDWFKKPVKFKRDLWSKIYFDKGGGNIWMSTYSALIKNKNNTIIGIATADISLDYLTKMISHIRLLRTGRAFIISQEGALLAPLDKNKVISKSLKIVLQNIDKKSFKPILSEIKKGRTGREIIKVKSGKYVIFYRPITGTNLNIGFVVDKSEIFSSLKKLHRNYIFLSTGAIILFIFLITTITRKVTEDISKIKNVSDKIAKGNFNVPIPDNLTAEAKDIASALQKMQKSLKEYIKKVAKNAKLENEIEYAKKIQETFILKEYSLQENSTFFAAKSYWAKQVGGDFYGIIKLNDNRLMCYVGDVSGKGIPSAIYVAIISSMLENMDKDIQHPKNVVELLNNYLVALSEKFSFTTMFLSIIDYNKNKFSFCNAGHNPPIFFNKSFNAMSFLLKTNVPLGIFSQYKYKQEEIPLTDISGAFIFTDGLLDAENRSGKKFGMINLINILVKYYKHTLPLITIKEIEKQHREFIGENELYDDTTMLLCKFG